MERTTPMHHNRSIISEMETYKSELKFSTREFIHTLIIPLRVVVIPKTRTTKLVRTELLSSVTNQEYMSIYCTFQEIQYVFCGVWRVCSLFSELKEASSFQLTPLTLKASTNTNKLKRACIERF